MTLLRTTFLTALIAAAAGQPAWAFDDGEFQTWLDFNVQGSVSDTVKIRMDQEIHWGDDAQNFEYQHTDFGLQWTADPHWALGVNYRQAYSEKDENWERESRPHVNVTYKTTYREVSVSNRSRLELRIRDNRSDIVRFRNKTTATFPVEWTRLGLRPYVAEEVFVDSDQGSYNQNRVFAGVKVALHRHLKGAAYYLWQSVDKDDFWDDAHIVGFSFSIVL